MANWRKTRYAGIYVAHSKACPAYDNPSARCRCKPSWRGRAWDSSRRRAVWSEACKHRSEALAWLAAMSKGADHLAELAKLGPTFEQLGEQWLDGVERGHIGRRRGRGKAYSDTTIAGMLRSWKYRLQPEFGGRGSPRRSPRSTGNAGSTSSPAPASPARPSRSTSRSRPASTPGHPHPHADSSRGTRCAWSSCRPTTRSHVCASPWRPRPRRCSPRSSPRTASPTRSPSTPACAAPRSTASSGTTSSTATASRRACSSAAPRAKPAPSAARRSRTTSAPSSPPPGSAKAARAPARSSTAR